MSQYMMLIYAPVDETKADEVGTDIQRWIALDSAIRESGHYVADHRLQPASTATTVRVRDGRTEVVRAPFAETGEYLSGYYVLEADDVSEVVEIAESVPLIHYGSVEIRPVFTP